MQNNKIKDPILPIEYKSYWDTEDSFSIFRSDVTFLEDFGTIKAGSFFELIIFHIKLGYIDFYEKKDGYQSFSIKFKIVPIIK